MAIQILTAHKACRNFEANAVIDPITGYSQEYKQLRQGPEPEIWIKAFANDLRRLSQVVGARMPKWNNMIFFFPRVKVSKFKTVTYGRIVAEIGPHKTETHRVCLMVEGYRLEFNGVTAT